jgi:hypothetical protein
LYELEASFFTLVFSSETLTLPNPHARGNPAWSPLDGVAQDYSLDKEKHRNDNNGADDPTLRNEVMPGKALACSATL